VGAHRPAKIPRRRQATGRVHLLAATPRNHACPAFGAGLARDPCQRSGLGGGLGGGFGALATSGTNLYVSGNFTNAGSVPASYIAKWDGKAWSALGSGLSSPYPDTPAMYCVVVMMGSDFYVGGFSEHAGGVPVNHIVKWGGHAWSAVGEGTFWFVWAVVGSGTNLYSGGGDTAGGVNVNNVAKWDGITPTKVDVAKLFDQPLDDDVDFADVKSRNP